MFLTSDCCCNACGHATAVKVQSNAFAVVITANRPADAICTHKHKCEHANGQQNSGKYVHCKGATRKQRDA